jgi:nicotinate-nucleotide adenylyltransferase
VGGPLTSGAAAAASAGRASNVRRVGVLGGTFDPIHRGHLALAHAARTELGLDEILFVPAGIPPHKIGRRISPAADRLAMVELAIAGERGFSVSRVEIDRPGPSFTADTVTELHEAAASSDSPIEVTVILSVDAFADLPNWHDPGRLASLARLAVAPRPGHASPDMAAIETRVPALAGRVSLLSGPNLDVSASDIRGRVGRGEPIVNLVPTVVAAYIQAHHLYRESPSEEGLNVTESAEPTESPPTSSTPDTSPSEASPSDASPSTAAPRADGLPSRLAVPPSERPSLDIARRIVELAEDKKAADIVLLDLTGLTTLADAFVICSGGSERQLDAIADGILEGMRAEKIRPIGREGTAVSHWVLVDFGAVVVHIFTPPERDYYSLEKHWAEAKTVLRVQ